MSTTDDASPDPAATMKFRLSCECLVDQDRMIGGDPIGYACTGRAVWESPPGVLFCESCREMLTTEPGRLTMPTELGVPFGRDIQVARIEACVRNLMNIGIASKPRSGYAFFVTDGEREQLSRIGRSRMSDETKPAAEPKTNHAPYGQYGTLEALDPLDDTLRYRAEVKGDLVEWETDRIASLIVSRHFIPALIGGKASQLIRINTGLCDPIVVVAVDWLEYKRAFGVLISSPTFDRVREGEPTPVLGEVLTVERLPDP